MVTRLVLVRGTIVTGWTGKGCRVVRNGVTVNVDRDHLLRFSSGGSDERLTDRHQLSVLRWRGGTNSRRIGTSSGASVRVRVELRVGRVAAVRGRGVVVVDGVRHRLRSRVVVVLGSKVVVGVHRDRREGVRALERGSGRVSSSSSSARRGRVSLPLSVLLRLDEGAAARVVGTLRDGAKRMGGGSSGGRLGVKVVRRHGARVDRASMRRVTGSGGVRVGVHGEEG